ncbi:hypothetical protein IMPR6_80215 [Imperialibacter sp. EC-SDR9]|nr:hypothetical protein IMPERIA75_200217 [Imperialibacter sp. 75]CAD5263725.1 hypothetical protein IMPERIA89_290216 [Imperialibacter sp. 89]VVT35499.1 hypothetical protein IMPR6_80215 [Imperialibacter sp. EC-SDR9]
MIFFYYNIEVWMQISPKLYTTTVVLIASMIKLGALNNANHQSNVVLAFKEKQRVMRHGVLLIKNKSNLDQQSYTNDELWPKT